MATTTTRTTTTHGQWSTPLRIYQTGPLRGKGKEGEKVGFQWGEMGGFLTPRDYGGFYDKVWEAFVSDTSDPAADPPARLSGRVRQNAVSTTPGTRRRIGRRRLRRPLILSPSPSESH